MIHPVDLLVPEVGEATHRALEVEVQVAQVAEVAPQVVQSKVDHPVEVQVDQVVEVALQAVRRKVALKERVHRDDCYYSTNHFEISEVLLLSKH
jgi:hypothetical protein